ncbi:hypothetical protein V8E51_002515 [Hyaloscypha variabilis]
MGWTFNVVNPDAATNAPTIAAVGIVFTVLSALVLSLRLYVRSSIVKKISVDDWIIVATWFLSFIFVAITLAQTRWGLGLQDVVDMPPQNLYYFGLLAYASSPFYVCAILGFKLSILFTFLRIATDRLHRLAIVGLAITCSMFHFCFFVIQLHLCNPVAKQWDPTITGGACIPALPLYTTMALITIIFEVLILLAPVPILLYSVFTPRKNFLIALIYVLGTFTTLIQIIRLLSITHANSPIDTSSLIIWSIIEISFGIMTSSLPSLAPLFKSFLSSELDTFKISLKIDHAKMVVKRVGRESPTWQRIILFLGYGELKGQKGEDRSGSKLESRSNSRMEWEGSGGGEWSAEDLNFEMGIIKTTEVIISREGSMWDEPKSTGLESWKEEP